MHTNIELNDLYKKDHCGAFSVRLMTRLIRRRYRIFGAFEGRLCMGTISSNGKITLYEISDEVPDLQIENKTSYSRNIAVDEFMTWPNGVFAIYDTRYKNFEAWFDTYVSPAYQRHVNWFSPFDPSRDARTSMSRILNDGRSTLLPPESVSGASQEFLHRSFEIMFPSFVNGIFVSSYANFPTQAEIIAQLHKEMIPPASAAILDACAVVECRDGDTGEHVHYVDSVNTASMESLRNSRDTITHVWSCSPFKVERGKGDFGLVFISSGNIYFSAASNRSNIAIEKLFYKKKPKVIECIPVGDWGNHLWIIKSDGLINIHHSPYIGIVHTGERAIPASSPMHFFNPLPDEHDIIGKLYHNCTLYGVYGKTPEEVKTRAIKQFHIR